MSKPKPRQPRTPAPPAPIAQRFRVETYDDGWWRAVDSEGAQVFKVTTHGVWHPITGVTAKRVRQRMAAELPRWREDA